MKKLLAVFLAALLCASALLACGGGGDTTTKAPESQESTKAPDASEGTTAAPETKEGESSTEKEGDLTELPRNETVYFGGLQWGVVATWNPIGVTQNNFAISAVASGSRTMMFETLYMYNFMDGSLQPLLADGDPQWSDDMSTMTVKIKEAAKWSDGTPVTATDVAKTLEVSKAIGNATATTYGAYIDKIEAVDEKTAVFHLALNDEGVPKNPLLVKDYLVGVYVCQAAWMDKVCERNNNDASAILQDKAEDVVWSGPYTRLYDNDQKVVLVRDDNYWGQDKSMWGTLPVPKYLAHALYADNAATEVAFKAGQIDVNQQFIGNVQKMWLDEKLPISTYYNDEPYGVCLGMPTGWFNMNIPVIAENVALRKAIAIAVDYPAIIKNAMTNQSPSFEAVPRSLMNPTAGEQALYDHDAVKDLQWAGNDIEGAKKLLDEAGIVDSDNDGWREYKGEKISLKAVCPNGWSDWQAAMEIVASAGKEIGVEITTLYPNADMYIPVIQDPDQKDYEIFMWSPATAAPSSPWARVMGFMSKDYVGVKNNGSGNWGQYVNDEADALLKKIPTMTDEKEIKDAYTELTKIYLTDVPSFSLMYRPAFFDAVNETIWTNYPSADDGRNIPPANCVSGYGIRALFELELAE